MPGILPMKVIKVGTNSQSRIAQACDRCRSKKIRCDGVTPCCTQCKNVGFECKTSDKLSRRAFPRGYTESLEERVRALESEVRELKDLLDEKDEKIDLLSKIHAFSPSRRPSNTASPSASEPAPSPQHESREEVFKVQQVPFLQKPEQKSDPFFMGSSSARAFVDTVKTKIQENGKPVANIDANVLLGRADLCKPAKRADLKHTPRIASDHLVNVFFQEWSPLFPVLHRPTFLNTYEEFVNDPDSIKDPISVAQLNLVFCTAALAKQSSKELIPYFESQWQGALGCVINESKLGVLQCLVLAQLYCLTRGDYGKLSFYTGLGVNLSRRLGLHQSQKRFSLGALTRETRKKVFWTLYTLDAFAAVTLGLPKLMKDEDIETEDPADVDDENVNERGFQATLPGESTKLSSALALFRVARILSKVTKDLYPASSSYELSLQKIGALSDELDAWRSGLAPHLRLEFSNDKPSTNIISSRCPLLGLSYYYIRSLIHRPVLCSGLGAQAQSSIIAVADASKHMIQILQLLAERGMSYTMCMNKTELIVSCGFGLIPQMLDLPSDSKLYKDAQLFITAAIELLENMASPSMAAFRKIVSSFAGVPDFIKPPIHRASSSETCPPTQDLPKNTKGQLQAIAARFSFNGIRNQLQSPYIKTEKRLSKHGSAVALSETVPSNLAPYARHRASHSSLTSVASEPLLAQKEVPTTNPSNMTSWNGVPNLDYLPLGSPTSSSNNDLKSAVSPDVTDWDQLISSFDPFDMNVSVPMPSTKGNSPACVTGSLQSQGSPPVPLDWSIDWSHPDSWSLFDVTGPHENHMPPKSVLSVGSNESLTSGEDYSSCDLGSEVRGYSIPHEDFYRLDDVDAAAAVVAGLS